MFKALKEKSKKIQRLNQDKMMQVILNDSVLQAQIVDLNQKQLYEHGVDANGNPTGEYAPSTIYGTSNFEGKIAKGQRYDHVTLKDTGAFYDSMVVKSLPEEIQIKADTVVESGVDLRDQWPAAVGLTKESIREILPEIKQTLVEKIRNAIA